MFALNMSSKDEDFPYTSCVATLPWFCLLVRVSVQNRHILWLWCTFVTEKETFLVLCCQCLTSEKASNVVNKLKTLSGVPPLSQTSGATMVTRAGSLISSFSVIQTLTHTDAHYFPL